MRPRWYSDPFRGVQGLHVGRTDQGVDVAGHGPIYPPARSVITIYTHSAGWPGPHGGAGAFIVGRIIRGRAAGRLWYLAENVLLVAGIHVGVTVRRSDAVGILQEGSPNCEYGWASSDGWRPLAQEFGGYHEGDCTLAGRNFAAMVAATGGPRFTCQGPMRGSLPPGFPTW